MLMADENVKIYLACGHTDMRKSINGLVALVEDNFALDPFEKALFVFCNKQRNRLKILTWEDNGFWLCFKRLERGRFRWPNQNQQHTMNLSLAELSHLIHAPGIEQKTKGRQVKK